MALSAEERKQFEERGFVLQRGLFRPETIRQLAEEIDGLHEKMAQDPPANVHLSWEELEPGRPPRIRQLMHSEKVSSILAAIARSPEVLSVMAQLIGPEVYLFHSKLLMKAARDGTFTPWHQDWGYWRRGSKAPTQVNCMLAIDAATEENGALRFVEGSQQRGPIDHKEFKTASFNLGLEGGLDAFESTLCEMEPGDAVFFGALVVHGSGPNRSEHDRRANTFAYDRAGNRESGDYPAADRVLCAGEIVPVS